MENNGAPRQTALCPDGARGHYVVMIRSRDCNLEDVVGGVLIAAYLLEFLNYVGVLRSHVVVLVDIGCKVVELAVAICSTPF